MRNTTQFFLPVKLYRNDLIKLDLLMLQHFNFDSTASISYTAPVPDEWRKEIVPLPDKNLLNRKLIPLTTTSSETRENVYEFVQKYSSESDSVRELCIELRTPRGFLRLILNNMQVIVDGDDSQDFVELRKKVKSFLKKRRPLLMYTPLIVSLAIATLSLIGIIGAFSRVDKHVFDFYYTVYVFATVPLCLMLSLFHFGFLFSRGVIFLNREQENEEKSRNKERREFYQKSIPIITSILSVVATVVGLIINSMK